MTAALHTSNITSLPLVARGKVRDNYAVGSDRILMVASDRLSAPCEMRPDRPSQFNRGTGPSVEETPRGEGCPSPGVRT